MLQRLELSIDHARWLEDVRSIPSETAERMGIVSVGENLAFEYRRGGEVMFRKIRSGDKRFWIEPKGAELFLWNEDCLSEAAAPGAPLVICEGELDACCWTLAGASHVVSVPNGGVNRRGSGDVIPSEDRRFAYLWDGNKHKPGLDSFSKIVLAVDSDETGLILRDELALRLGEDRCWFVTYPAGCKDANDVIIKHGKRGVDALVAVLADAKPLVPDKLVPFSHIPPRPQTLQYGSGWQAMDDHLLLVPPELVVVTGPPGSGKSRWTLNWVANLARWGGLKGAILQFEDSPDRNRRHLLKHAEEHKGPLMKDVTVYVGGGAPTTRKEAVGPPLRVTPEAWVDAMFRTIAPAQDEDSEVSFNLSWLHEAIHESAVRHDCKWVLVDPWNEVEHLWSAHESETDYTNRALRDMKRLARRYKIAIIIVAHPSKSGGQAGTIQTMSLYDVSGSAAWKNKADHGIVVMRDGATTHVKVDKCKDHETMGVPGVVSFTIEENKSTFSVVKTSEAAH
jgi:twinkle protein